MNYPANLSLWMLTHNVSPAAMADLVTILTGDAISTPGAVANPRNEATVQANVRLAAAQAGWHLWRNNNGAALVVDENTGEERFIRFGLGNDNKKLNENLKSSDLIGWRPVDITPGHVGMKIAQFVSREVKDPHWTFSNTKREAAQANWINLVNACGGDAAFTTGRLT